MNVHRIKCATHAKWKSKESEEKQQGRRIEVEGTSRWFSSSLGCRTGSPSRNPRQSHRACPPFTSPAPPPIFSSSSPSHPGAASTSRGNRGSAERVKQVRQPPGSAGSVRHWPRPPEATRWRAPPSRSGRGWINAAAEPDRSGGLFVSFGI